MMETIRKYLSEQLGYAPYEVEITMEDLEAATPESRKMVLKLIDGMDVSHYSCGDYSVGKLMSEKGLNAIASILAIDNLKKDYDRYARLLQRPNK